MKSDILKQKLEKVEWLRPQQIAPHVRHLGFMKSKFTPKSLEEANEVNPKDICDGLRIYQGEM